MSGGGSLFSKLKERAGAVGTSLAKDLNAQLSGIAKLVSLTSNRLRHRAID
jgi:hypothetical protein